MKYLHIKSYYVKVIYVCLFFKIETFLVYLFWETPIYA